MWTEITRPQYLRKELRYASDVTEAEWRMIEPWLPAPRRLGRPRKTALLAVVNALFYVAVLCRADGLSVAAVAGRFSALLDGPALTR